MMRICHRTKAPARKNMKLTLCAIAVMGFILLNYNYLEWKPNERISTRKYDFSTDHYLVSSPICHIPDLFPHTLYEIRKNPFEVKCDLGPDLTEKDGLFLILHKDRVTYYNISMEDLNCNYRIINVTGSRHYKLSNAIELTDPRTLIHDEGIVVTCFHKRNESKIIYKNVHYFYQPYIVEEKRKLFKMRSGDRGAEPEKLSVVVMGLDGLSRGALKRHMPKTFAYLTKELKAYDFQGNTKVGSNTDQNLMATLIGLDFRAPQWCRKSMKSEFDRCPIIWKNFSANGYVTVHIEDALDLGSFHYLKKGFLKKPTDYYFMPFYRAYCKEKTTHFGGQQPTAGALCLGNRKSIAVVQDQVLEVAEALRDIPYFAFCYTGSYTHDFSFRAAAIDEPTLKYLKSMNERKFFEHTILFLLSDHGARHGPFRATYPGMLEEHMPFFLGVFPQWLREKHPHIFTHMSSNTKRLISNFDQHATLIDIAYGTYRTQWKNPFPTKYGISLFREIPLNRSCENAMIPENSCNCELFRDVPLDDPLLKEASLYALDMLNSDLQPYPKCAKLMMQKILSGRVSFPNNNRKPIQKSVETESSNFLVSFMTLPGNATMEASVRYIMGKFSLSGEVSRTNLYGNQSHCLKHDVLRKYCYCKDLLQ